MAAGSLQIMANLKHIIDPGELDRRITLQTASGAADLYGDTNTTWYDVADLWAKVEWGTGDEETDANQIAAFDKVTFTIRYRTVTHRMRILYDSKYYDIETIGEAGGRKRFLKIITKQFDSNPI